ncbi:TPA: GIY-YIG nuclease family protein [Yersinia enterocolitica]
MNNLEKWMNEPPTEKLMEFPETFKANGWVYILQNDSMPGIFKVGMTTTHPIQRANELSRTTGVPTKFSVVESFISVSPEKHEKEIHKILARHRVNEDREFFKCPIEKIISACHLVIPDGAAKTVNDLIEKYNLISFESLGRVDVADHFSDFGINAYGGRNELVIRLAMFGAELVRYLTEDGGAVVFFDNKFTLLKPEEDHEF